MVNATPCPFAHDSTSLRPKWMSKLLTDRSIEIEGRGYKAISGNCWLGLFHGYNPA